MVVISIMVVITALVLMRQSRFDSATLLRSLAYSVALSVRQAQIYGSSVLGTTTQQTSCGTGGFFSATTGTCYAAAYGVHFVYNSTTYTLFADLNNNGKYDLGEAVKTFTFNNGYQLADLCVTWISPSGTVSCHADGINELDIVFHRPNPEACLATPGVQPDVCAPGAAPFYTQAKLTIENTKDSASTRSVTVTQTGEIEVCALAGC